MTQNTTGDEPDETQQDPVQFGPGDPMLRELLAELLAHHAKGDPVSIQITLMTTGGIVTGELVSALQWLDAVDSQASIYKNLLVPFREELEAAWSADKIEPFTDEMMASISHVHLVNARIFAGTMPVPGYGDPGVPWRGRLSEVSGWIFGIAGNSQP